MRTTEPTVHTTSATRARPASVDQSAPRRSDSSLTVATSRREPSTGTTHVSTSRKPVVSPPNSVLSVVAPSVVVPSGADVGDGPSSAAVERPPVVERTSPGSAAVKVIPTASDGSMPAAAISSA